MRRRHGHTKKYILLVIMLIAVFILPSCRTRITNNSEVSNVQYDEDGFLSETYEMRREELGLSTAERPILPDFGSAEDNNDDFSESGSIDYNPEDYQEYFTESQTNNNTGTNSSNRSRTSGSGGTRSSGRRSGSSGDDNKNIVVILDLNDGRDSVLGSITVEEGGTYEGLPKENPKHPKGYKFLGWFTAKNGGTQVRADTKVTDKNNHTLYAHWDGSKKDEKNPKDVIVTIKYNIEGRADKTETVKKGASYRFPNPGDSKEGYTFGGWKVGEKIYQAGQEIQATSNITISAQWDNTTKYKVIFTDGQGNILSEQDIEEGKGATAPQDPTRPGYTFTGWDKEYNNITGNTEITAQWEKKEAKEYWQDIFDHVVKEDKEPVKCYVIGELDVKKFNASSVDIGGSDSAKYAFVFNENDKDKIPANVDVYLIDKEAFEEPNELKNNLIMINILHSTNIAGAEALEGKALIKKL